MYLEYVNASEFVLQMVKRCCFCYIFIDKLVIHLWRNRHIYYILKYICKLIKLWCKIGFEVNRAEMMTIKLEVQNNVEFLKIISLPAYMYFIF